MNSTIKRKKTLWWIGFSLPVAVSLLVGLKLGFNHGVQVGKQQAPPPPVYAVPAPNLFIYTPNEGVTAIEKAMSVSFSGELSQEVQLQQLAEVLSRYEFCALPIEVVGIDTNIATLNLREHPWNENGNLGTAYPGCAGNSWQRNYFQGSTGGYVTSTVLARSFLQPDYTGSWIEGVQFLYEGTPIDSNTAQFQHMSLNGIITRESNLMTVDP